MDNENTTNKDNRVDSVDNTGRGMIFIAWIIAIGLLTWIFGLWESQMFNPNTSPTSFNHGEITEVTLKRNHYGHYITTGEVNHKPVIFLLDTGATLVAVPGEIKDKLGLTAGKMHYTHTANGTAQAYSTTIEQLAIGDIVFYDVKASIVPNMKGEEILLGMSVLKNLEFTQKGNQLTLRQQH
jgi:aspartyl protease family protein